MTTFSIQSFGCRVNQAEAFAWAEEFQRHGLKFENDHRRAELILLNTCTITARADRDVRRFLRRMARTNPQARLVVTGCYAEQAGEELDRIPQVWKIYPNREKSRLAEEILAELPIREPGTHHAFRSRPLVKIQDGCDFQCAFCIIPSVKGPSVSFPREKIVSRVRELFREGYAEVGLTGVHLCLYGRDHRPRGSLIELLDDIDALEEPGRIRLTSLDPRFMNEDLCRKLADSPKLQPHFHLSLQHGSDEVIRRMGRRITISRYGEVLAFLRREVPGAALGADIIVGFPGETDDDFYGMRAFLEASPLDYFHVFSYSPRPGTEAAEWPQVDSRIVTERAAELRALSTQRRQEFHHRHLDTERDAIVIKWGEKGVRILTDNYIDVEIPRCEVPEGGAVRVHITELGEKGIQGRTA